MFEAGFLFFYSGTFTRQISFKLKWWKLKEGWTNQKYIWVWIICLKLLQKSISAANCSIAHLDGIRLFNYLETQSRKSNIILELWQVFTLKFFIFFLFSVLFFTIFNDLQTQSRKSNIILNFGKFLQFLDYFNWNSNKT